MKKSLPPQIMLAPMEGVVDTHMRDFLTHIGGFDRCVTEFIRVVDHVYPEHVFSRFCPELENGGRTSSGVPVYVQFLGSDSQAMAGNARKAAMLGALGVDVNFGCPSKTVNKRDGGSAILRDPQRVLCILRAVRDAVPATTPVTAKIRLGYEHCDDFSEIIEAVHNSNVDELCIHARTKKQAYKPPAHWHRVAEARRKLKIPVIVNGEIWSCENAQQARFESNCDDIMLGRGAIAKPDLARHIQAHYSEESYTPLSWDVIWDKVCQQSLIIHAEVPKYAASRTKQWLGYLKLHYPQAHDKMNILKRCKTIPEMAKLWD